MSLKYALMCSLCESSATGYELTQRFRERMGNVWNASHQQIYRELAVLLQQDWLSVEVVPQAGKPDRKLYRATPEGQKALEEWVNLPSRRPAVRDPLLLKLFAGDMIDPRAMLAEIREHQANWREQLAAYRVTETRYFSQPEAMTRHYRLQYLALRKGISALEDWLNWAEDLEKELENELE